MNKREIDDTIFRRDPSNISFLEQNKKLNISKYRKVLNSKIICANHAESPIGHKDENVGSEAIEQLKKFEKQRILSSLKHEQFRENYRTKVREHLVTPKKLDFSNRAVLLTSQNILSSKKEFTTPKITRKQINSRSFSAAMEKSEEQGKELVNESPLRGLEPLNKLLNQKKLVAKQILANVFNHPQDMKYTFIPRGKGGNRTSFPQELEF